MTILAWVLLAIGVAVGIPVWASFIWNFRRVWRDARYWAVCLIFLTCVLSGLGGTQITPYSLYLCSAGVLCIAIVVCLKTHQKFGRFNDVEAN